MMSRAERSLKTKTLWLESDWQDVSLFMGANAEAFKPTWEKARDSWISRGKAPSTFLSWHWPALIPVLGIPWLAARKIWPLFWTIVGTIVALNILSVFVKSPPSGTAFLIFLVPIMARNFYVQFAVSKIARIKQAIPVGPAQDQAIAAAGGLHMSNGYLAGAACAVVAALEIFSLIWY